MAELPVELTENEREVLRLFLQMSDPKAIALAIGRSPETVRQRLGRARRKLGVNRTLDAAMMLRAAEDGTYQTIVHTPLVRGDRPRSDAMPVAAESGGGITPPSFPTKGWPWNASPPRARIIMIVLGIFVLTIATVATVSIGETLSRIARRH